MIICGLRKCEETSDRRISISCYEKATKLVKTLYSDMKNLEKQYQRIEKGLRIMEKKEKKTGSFQECAQELETIGGGDENNLLCHDQEDLKETHQLRSLAVSLKNCPEKVQEACHFSTREQVKPNCEGVLEQAKSELQRCLDIPSHRSCSCWENKEYIREIMKKCKQVQKV